MNEIYNQRLDIYSRNGCILYGIGHIFMLNFGITVYNSFLLKTLKILADLGLWFPNAGGVFETIYNWTVNEINKKLEINVKVLKTTISKLQEGDTKTYGLGIKSFNVDWVEAFDDDILTLEEAQKLSNKFKGIGHHLVYDSGYLIDSYTAKKIECSLDTLKKLVKLGLIWDTCRTIIPADNYTKTVLFYTRRMAEAESKGKLKEYMETNKKQTWFNKSKELYFYGKR